MNTITTTEKTFSVGRFFVSPLTRLTDTGEYAPSISIRSGQGRSSHDRVFRFTPHFPSHEAAVQYAVAQGLHLLDQGQLA